MEKKMSPAVVALAKELALAEGFACAEAPILIGMFPAKAWEARVPRAEALLKAA